MEATPLSMPQSVEGCTFYALGQSLHTPLTPLSLNVQEAFAGRQEEFKLKELTVYNAVLKNC